MCPYVCITFFSLLITKNVYCSLTTEYYENLISQRLSEAANYQQPQNNAEFKIGLESSDIKDFGSYDFIIVGAGTAGSVVATRLSEISEWNILLLEAGDDEDDFSLIPNIYPYLQFTEKNWGYFTTPQKNCCLGMKEKRCLAPIGKSIGGTSAINAVQYVRGNPKDYDKWVELGNPGWSYEEVLPYFIKSENSQIDGDSGYHGTGGIWNVEHPSPVPLQMINFFEGHAELNVTIIDYNGRKQIGASRNQINIKHGKRQGTGTAFLDYARRRKNLKIVTRTMVTKINIDKNKNTAEGVEFVTDKAKFTARARKEVIVSAGAINSPQLLMLSGIGPKDHLKELNIDVIADLPVGENLTDHPLFTGLNFRTNYTHATENLTDLVEKYLKGFGPLTIPSYINGYGFISTKNSPENVPMIEYTFTPSHGISIAPSSTPNVLLSYYDEELVSKYTSKITPKTDITFLMLLLHEKSRGRITLKSNNPIDFPNIDLNINSEPEDIHNIIEGIEFVIKLTQTEAFQRLNTTLIDYGICEELDKYSKEFWTCIVRHMTRTCYHITGTTAMGPKNSTSVVDYNLKVHGIGKLRVVDGGIIPTTLSAPPYATIVMVAEKISDVIKADHQTRKG